MKTKVVVSMSIEVAHSDGTKLRKRDVAAYVKGLIEGDEGTDYLRPGKVVVRAVYIDPCLSG